MLAIPAWVIEGGPWAILGFLILAFAIARNRGILISGKEFEREMDRVGKDTDRIIALYMKQIDMMFETAGKKDEVIAKLQEQIGKLLSDAALSTHALNQIMEEAKKRGLV